MEEAVETKPVITDLVIRVANGSCDDDEDDDCCVIDPVDVVRTLNLGRPSDDVILVADKGPVALRDFPHPRHLCANFPLDATCHEEYCSKVAMRDFPHPRHLCGNFPFDATCHEEFCSKFTLSPSQPSSMAAL
ncbi:hypothetical protein Cni_G07744 [Canna indica]|uniref:Uncharacterized protein n=1 Tax=Canna indica TaxID=4628 RepID=A0AAQ3K1P8_9LILI|nr:hypothetical protein Cni_G07744 [Canna indica]